MMVETPTELDTQQIYTHDTSDDLPLGLIPLAVDHKINNKYPKSLHIPILNNAYTRVCILRATMPGIFNAFEIKSTQISNISWTKTENSQDDMKNSSTDLTTILQAFNWSRMPVNNIIKCTRS